MTKLAFIEDGEVTEFPVTRDFLKTKYPNTSFPLDLDTGGRPLFFELLSIRAQIIIY